MKILIVGCDKSTKGGMWKIVENYLSSETFIKKTNLKYIPTSITGSIFKKVLFTSIAYVKILYYFIIYRPDILHVHMSERGSVFRKNIVMSMARLFKTKIIIHMHGAEFEKWYKGLNQKKKEYVINILAKADRMIILGKYWKPFISSIYPESKIEVLHNAVKVPYYNEYNIKATDILFLGVVGQRKGAYDLLQAFCECAEDIPKEVRLIYYGPNYEGKIKQKIAECGHSDRVKYKGWLYEEEKKKVFDSTIVNVLPSYNEGLPMTILETMAAGIPNISTFVAAIPEVINDKNGILVHPGNIDEIKEAIRLVVEHSDRRSELSKNSFATIKNKFSLEVHINRLINLYEQLIEEEK